MNHGTPCTDHFLTVMEDLSVIFMQAFLYHPTIPVSNIGHIGQGQGLREYTAPFDAMPCLLAGEAQITISGKLHMVNAGEYIIMPANQPHAVQAQKRFKIMLVMIRR